MRYLLDTDVLAEFRRPRPAPAVVAWLRATPPGNLFTSVVVVGEILQGILALEPREPKGAASLRRWLDEVEATHAVLPVDHAVIDRWAALRTGHPGRADFEDMLIAATAAAHRLTVATRNVRDFEPLGVSVLDPWEWSEA